MLLAECRCRESRGLVAGRKPVPGAIRRVELVPAIEAMRGGRIKHTLRTVVHDIIVVEQRLTL